MYTYVLICFFTRISTCILKMCIYIIEIYLYRYAYRYTPTYTYICIYIYIYTYIYMLCVKARSTPSRTPASTLPQAELSHPTGHAKKCFSVSRYEPWFELLIRGLYREYIGSFLTGY